LIDSELIVPKKISRFVFEPIDSRVDRRLTHSHYFVRTTCRVYYSDWFASIATPRSASTVPCRLFWCLVGATSSSVPEL